MSDFLENAKQSTDSSETEDRRDVDGRGDGAADADSQVGTAATEQASPRDPSDEEDIDEIERLAEEPAIVGGELPTTGDVSLGSRTAGAMTEGTATGSSAEQHAAYRADDTGEGQQEPPD